MSRINLTRRIIFTVILTALLASVFAFVDVKALSSIPSYNGEPYKVVEDNIPSFSKTQKKSTTSVEKYYKLDSLGRCTKAYANIGKKLMPTEERGDISSIYPSGWKKGMGWQRCHLIGFQLTGENANKKNLITGTRYMNVSGMLPFENMVADYIKETGNHVLYRVTPMYKGDELIARGVHMEAWSVEDSGEGICFNVFCFNKQPGKKINYTTGKVTSSSSSTTQKITVGVKSKTYKKASLKKSSKHFNIKVKTTTGNYKCTKKSGSKRLSISKKGKVTVKKGTGTGTYKMKVKIYAKGKGKVKSRTVTKTITVKVKKSTATTVYRTPSGKCYHSSKSCSTLSRSKSILSLTLSKAKDLGLTPCKVCH